MRNGKLLVQRSPKSLMRQFNTSLLEDIVLTLCEEDASNNNPNSNSPISSSNSQMTNFSVLQRAKFYPPLELQKKSHRPIEDYNRRRNSSQLPSIQYNSGNNETLFRLKALVQRNICLMLRNLP